MVTPPRSAHPDVEQLFLDRWSPRAFDESTISDEELAVLFDAARWAPSAFNVQPWRFLYAQRSGPDFARFLAVLDPFNQSWAHRASALVFILSDSLLRAPGASEDIASYSHSFDAGSAWALFALQATRSGLYTHAMNGVDFAAARTELAIPERFRIEAAVAVGRRGDPSLLAESLRDRDVPSPRNAIEAFAFPGNFPG